jgi:hypothetical protein
MSGDLQCFQMSWPRVLEEQVVAGSFRALAAEAALGPVVLDVIGQGGSVVHLLSLPAARASSIIRRLTIAAPGLRATRIEEPLPQVKQALRIKLSSRRRPLRSDNNAETALAILTALSGTRRGEVLHLQWVLGPRLRPVAIPNEFIDFKRTSPLGIALTAPFSPPARVDPEVRLALKAKQSLSGWRVIGRLGATAADPARARQLLSQLLAALRTTESPGLKLEAANTNPRKLTERAVPWRWPSVLNEAEIIGLSSWPLGEITMPGLVRSPFALVSPVDQVPRVGRVVGDSISSGKTRPLALNGVDAQRHTWLMGPTGVGKSTLMGQLILADIRDGRGVIVIDSKRDLIDDVLARLPDDRRDDVVVLDPSDPDALVGFNPLSGSPAQAPLLADRLVSIFRSLYGDNLGPRSEDILHAGLLTLGLAGNQTLPALPLLFTNTEYRRRLTANLNDPLGLGTFWSWFERISDAERRNAVAPLMNKLRAFLLRPSMRRTLGQAEPRFSIRQVFTERKLLFVNLAKGDLGPETAQLFGALLLNEIWQQTLSRASVPANRRAQVMVHIDEFHEYLRLSTPLADVLVAARGYGVGLTIVNQHLDQLTPDVRSAVLGNAGSRVMFRLNENDARLLARDSSILTPDDFRGLGAYDAYASLMAQGARTPYASVHTRPFDEPLRNPATLRRASSARWGRPHAEVDAALEQLISQPAPRAATPLGRRKRPEPES